MAHTCGCHGHGSAAAQAPEEPITAAHRVSEVAKRHPGALEAMKAMGIDHCCGGLTRAAAAAGVPRPALLETLTPVARSPR